MQSIPLHASGASGAGGLRVARWALVVLAAALWAGPAAVADEPTSSPAEVEAAPEPADLPPQVGLDQLLRLPNSFEAELERRGGNTALEWRTRYEKARGDIEQAKEKLAAAEKELDRVSGTSAAYQVSLPGANDPQTSPLSLRLREQIKDHRVEIQESERQLRTLDVEADLAAVPPEWRK